MTAKAPLHPDQLPCNAVRPRGGLSIDALRQWAAAAGHRFVVADLSGCQDKPAVLKAIGRAFAFPQWFGANLDALYDCLTDLPEQSPAPGYLVVLDHLPYTQVFDVEQRDALLDVFRDATEAFADQKLPLRVLYS